jgi:hypothetical protein
MYRSRCQFQVAGSPWILLSYSAFPGALMPATYYEWQMSPVGAQLDLWRAAIQYWGSQNVSLRHINKWVPCNKSQPLILGTIMLRQRVISPEWGIGYMILLGVNVFWGFLKEKSISGQTGSKAGRSRDGRQNSRLPPSLLERQIFWLNRAIYIRCPKLQIRPVD